MVEYQYLKKNTGVPLEIKMLNRGEFKIFFDFHDETKLSIGMNGGRGFKPPASLYNIIPNSATKGWKITSHGPSLMTLNNERIYITLIYYGHQYATPNIIIATYNGELLANDVSIKIVQTDTTAFDVRSN